jgi:hypothetical protein
MPGDTIQLIFEEDPNSGPLMDYMLDYSDQDFERYVISESSDSDRRAIMYAKGEIQAELVKLSGGYNNVETSTKDLRPELIRERNFRRSMRSSSLAPQNEYEIPTHPPGGALAGSKHAHGYSGPEFIELIKMVATFGGAAGIGAATIKGIKDVVVKIIDSRSKRKVTIKVGTNTLQIEGPASKADVNRLVDQLEKMVKVTSETKQSNKLKGTKATPALEKPKASALPPPGPQLPKVKPPKKKPKQKQQS